MGFYTAIDEQTIQPGQSVIFTLTQIRDNTGNVKHSDGTGSFVLSGGPNKRRSCCPCCDAPCKQYPVNFGANIAIPTGGTVDFNGTYGNINSSRNMRTGRYMTNMANGMPDTTYGHSIKDRMVAALEPMYDKAESGYERNMIDKAITAVQSLN